jgi:hypothetical protein
MEAGASGRYSIVDFCSWGLRSFHKLAEEKATGGQVLLANNYQFCRQRLGGPERKGPGTGRLGTRQRRSGRVLPSKRANLTTISL